MKRIILLSLLALACRAAPPPAVHDGDIVFHTSRSSQSLAIQRATHSPYSHMGVGLFRGGRPYVFEAVSTVRFTPLDAWLSRGSGRHFVVKRLRNASAQLTPEAIQRLRASARRFEGLRYDLTFEWSDERMYCSELVWKLFDRALHLQIGELQRIKDFDLSDPAVRGKMKERYGDFIPSDETVISPVAIFNSPLLDTIAQQ